MRAPGKGGIEMEWWIDRFERGSEEYRQLTLAAAMLEHAAGGKIRYHVEDCYWDYGQEWWWTTIIAYDQRHVVCTDYQAIYPPEQKKILLADSIKEMAEVVEEILERQKKY